VYILYLKPRFQTTKGNAKPLSIHLTLRGSALIIIIILNNNLTNVSILFCHGKVFTSCSKNEKNNTGQ